MIPDRSYAEILTQLHEFDSYLTALKVTRRNLRSVITNIEEIQTASMNGRDSGLALEREASGDHFRELIWSLTEGSEWVDIFRGIRDQDESTVRRLLRKAMRAPVDPRLETASTYEARNTKFELLLGARFHFAGATVSMGGAADLCLNRIGFRLYVECKRPQGEQNISKRTAEACTQLLNRFNAETHPNPVGMVAISVSKALSGGEKMLYVDRESDIKATLTQEAERIRQSYCRAISNADPRVIGIICHSFTPTLIRPERRLVAASQFDIFPRNVDGVLPLSGDDLRILLSCL